jgi:hypothetical protein
MYITTTEKLSVTINKGQKPGQFWKIKKPPLDTNSPEKEAMSGKTLSRRLSNS